MLDSLDQFSKSWASSKEASEGCLVFGYHYEVMDLTYLYINRLQLLSLSVSKLPRERRNPFWLASEFYWQMSLAAFRHSGMTRYSRFILYISYLFSVELWLLLVFSDQNLDIRCACHYCVGHYFQVFCRQSLELCFFKDKIHCKFVLILPTQIQYYRVLIYWLMYFLIKFSVLAASQKKSTTEVFLWVKLICTRKPARTGKAVHKKQ